MPSLKETRYQCSVCNRMRGLTLDVAEHELNVSLSENGLVLYSDIHRCENGILGINNVYIDNDYAIRSFENLQLPKKRKPVQSSIPGLPMPAPRMDPENKKNDNYKIYIIKQVKQGNYFRIRIIDHRLQVTLVIGDINYQKEKMISEISSDLGTICIEYYSSQLHLNTNLEKWLSILVNLLEKLPPTTLGLFIETLMFIHSLYFTPPTLFLIKQLKTILTSHETYFLLQEDVETITEKLNSVATKYGEKVANVMNELISYLAENPMIPLQYYTRTHSEDLVYLINLFLILEQEGLLSIERPGIVEEEIDAELSIDIS